MVSSFCFLKWSRMYKQRKKILGTVKLWISGEAHMEMSVVQICDDENTTHLRRQHNIPRISKKSICSSGFQLTKEPYNVNKKSQKIFFDVVIIQTLALISFLHIQVRHTYLPSSSKERPRPNRACDHCRCRRRPDPSRGLRFLTAQDISSLSAALMCTKIQVTTQNVFFLF